MCDENLCSDCNGACCQRHTILPLSGPERKFFLEAGAILKDTGLLTRDQEEEHMKIFLASYPSAIVFSSAPEDKRYFLIEDCPYLEPETQDRSMRRCLAHDWENRPRVCEKFEPGSPECLKTRDVRYLHIE